MRTGVLAIAGIVAASVSARAETTVDIHLPEAAAPEVSPSTIRVGFVDATVSLDRVRLELRAARHAVVGRLVLAYSSPGSLRNIVVPLALPHGAALRSLAITTGVHGRRGERPVRLVAKAVEATRARALYEEILYGRSDPALLEWQAPAGDLDRVTLEAFPIGQHSPGLVEIDFELPLSTSVTFDPDGQLVDRVEVVVDGRRRVTDWVRTPLPIAIAALPRAAAGPRPSLVTAKTSLVAAPARWPRPIERQPIVVFVGTPHRHALSPVDKTTIRRTMRHAHGRLRHCYEKTALMNPAIAGTANFHFTVQAGRATAISIDGELDHPEIVACFLAEVRTWTFPTSAETASERVQVNAPIRFAMPSY